MNRLLAGYRGKRLFGGLAAALLVGLPIPIPVPIPVPTSLPSPALPSSLPVLPSAPSNVLSQSPQATPAAQPTPARPPAAIQPAVRPPANGQGLGQGITIPLTAIYVDSPLSIALLVALAVLPLLAGIWLLVFGRTISEARRARDAQTRLMLAADLGLRPRDLVSMSTRSLFSLREKSAFDELTGVLRRAAGISAAEREIARARRQNSSLAVVFLDVDGLKETNDRSGHAAGDEMLRGLVAALKEGLNPDDIVVRYGGDEFVCVLPEATAKEARARLGDIQLEASKAGIRFSTGAADLRRNDDVVSLLARADGDLYDFKVNRGEIVQFPPGRDQKSVIA